MTITHLSQAVQECNNAQITFNRGTVSSFLFDNKWYPLRAVVNRAMHLAGTTSILTTNQCLVRLVRLGVWTRVSEVYFGDSLPRPISQEEMTQEIKNIAKTLATLAK